MAKRRSRGSKTRHGTRKWVLKALADAPSAGMPTAAIQRKVEQLSGSKIPAFSTYQSLRTLTKRGNVRQAHRGRENLYWLAGASQAPPVHRRRGRPPKAAGSPPPMAVEMPSEPSAPVMAEVTSVQVLHKLAPGEVAILNIGETHIEAATNEHGKLVIAHHPRQKGSGSR